EAPENGYAFSDLSADSSGVRLKMVEVETSAATDVAVPSELLASPIYDHVRRTYARLADIAGGLPPFSLNLGKKRAEAETFEQLRDEAITLAKEGIQI